VLELIPLAEKVKKLQAICKNCGANASFSYRMENCGKIELIGDGSVYKPLCRPCFLYENKQKELKEEALHQPAAAESFDTQMAVREKSVSRSYSGSSSQYSEDSPQRD